LTSIYGFSNLKIEEILTVASASVSNKKVGNDLFVFKFISYYKKYMESNRVAVFIDNSNIFHCLHDLRKIDDKWVCLYNPLKLSQKLAGYRKIVYIGFYCVRPPSYLLAEGGYHEEQYKIATRFYETIEKMPDITVKYGNLKGSKDNLIEKNVDTQISTDLVKMAAMNEYDIAILISNDGDYVSAAQSVQDTFKKKIEVGYFRSYISMNLKRVCDLSRRLRQAYFEKLTI